MQANENTARTPLLTARDVARQLMISRDNAIRIMHVYGLRLGRRWYITSAQLDRALDAMAESHIKY